MSFLDDLIGKGHDELWDTPTPEIVRDQRNAVASDVFDKMTWAAVNDMAPSLSLARMEMAEEYPTSPEALEDVFNLLHQGAPLFADENAMEGEYVGNHQLVSALFEQPEFTELRKETMHDEYSSTFTMMTLTDPLREAFEAMKAQQEAQQGLADAMQEAQQAQASGEGQEAAGEALQEALAGVQQANESATQANQKVWAAGHQADQDLKEDARAAKSYGLGEGEQQKMSFEERRALAQKLRNSRMDKLAKLIGAFRSFGDAERRRKIKHAPSEIFDYKLSNDLTKLAPGEVTNLATPELSDLFWLRHAQHALLTREVRGPENAGQGPIIVVCDESGSMTNDLDDAGNTCEAWSKAVALALCDQAKRGKRDFYYIGFSGGSKLSEQHFAKGVAPIDKVMDFVESFMSGGTNFITPLTRAAEIIEEHEARGSEKPDVVFITDGQAYVPDEFVEQWHERLERLDARCYGIQVGGTEASPVLKSLSHRTININRLNASPEGVRDLFRQL